MYMVIVDDGRGESQQVAMFKANDPAALRDELRAAFADPEWWGYGWRFVIAVKGDVEMHLRDPVHTENFFDWEPRLDG